MGVDMPLNKTNRPKVKIEIKREWEIMQNKSIAQYSKERKGVMYFKEGCLSPWQLTIQREVNVANLSLRSETNNHILPLMW